MDGVANKVRQRLTNASNDRLITFRALALDVQAQPLAGCRFKFSHDTWHTAEDRPDRLGAVRHGAIMAFAGQLVPKIGRASRRERVVRYLYLSVVPVHFKQHNTTKN